ncbi:hypothetical protein ACFV5J_26680 [Streptomyces zaomyceticus]|uniref:hypothetical protein n=1 Tax=Streptomyces zaomyceticus TaxID=68286 RepID=UPI00364B9A0A
MSLHTLPVHHGLRVPAIAPWSAERDVTPALVMRGGRVAYVDPDLDAAQRHRGALWRVYSLGPGRGEPEFAGIHPARQRLAMRRLLCQVCFKPTAEEAARYGGTLFLSGASDDAGTSGPIEEGEQTTHPPLHLACAWESATRCKHLLRGMVAARVKGVRQWGVLGVLHASLRGLVVPIAPRVRVGFHEADLPRVLARQAVAELHDVTPVDLRGEAECAGLIRGSR